jgi:hypothetical protein
MFFRKHEIFYNYEDVFLINGISIGDSRMNPFKERENDTIYVSVGQTDLVFSLIFSNV